MKIFEHQLETYEGILKTKLKKNDDFEFGLRDCMCMGHSFVLFIALSLTV